MATFSIYIASSFRNLHAVQLLRNTLLAEGFAVFDWTSLAPPLPHELSPSERRQALDADERGDIFRYCAEACGSADAVVYMGQSGQDAGIEVGIAYNAGVPVFGLAGPLEKPGLMLARAVVHWFDDVQSLLIGLNVYANRNG